MGIFDRLMGSKDVKLTPRGALALGALTIIASDGQVDEGELLGLGRLVRGDRAALDKAVKVLRENDVRACVEIVAAALTSEQQRLTVLANLIDLAMADGMLAGAEKDLLGLYLERFQIAEDAVRNIIEAAAIKNNTSALD